MIDNLSGNQLNAPAQAILSDGRRIGVATLSQSDHEKNMETSSADTIYNTPEWSRDISLPVVNQIFPEVDYSTYRDFSPVQLFELFFDEEAYNLIVQQTLLYAHGKGENQFTLTLSKIKVVFGILSVSGLVPVPCRRMFWRNSPITRSEAVFNDKR